MIQASAKIQEETGKLRLPVRDELAALTSDAFLSGRIPTHAAMV